MLDNGHIYMILGIVVLIILLGGFFLIFFYSRSKKPQKFVTERKQVRAYQSFSYLTIISELLLHHHEFRTHSDMLRHLGPLFFKDITDDPRMQLLDEMRPLPIGFNQKIYQFKESKNRDGIIEAVFYEDRLVNFRGQLLLHRLNDEQVSEYMNSELFPLISDIVGTENFEYDAVTNIYHYDDFDGFIVAFRTVTGAPSLSVYITDRKYA